MVFKLYDRTEYAAVRPDTLDSLDRYAKDGIPPGGFLTAVLENDLMGAMGRADLGNRAALREITGYVYNELPHECHGYKGVVAEWCERIREEKENAETATG